MNYFIKNYNRTNVKFFSFLGRVFLFLKFKLFNFNYINKIEKKKNYDKKVIYDAFFKLLKYSYNNIKFYKDYYDSLNFDINSVKTFADIKKVPVINKDILNTYTQESRISKGKRFIKSNTGGTSGNTLSIYNDTESNKREYFHIQRIFNDNNYDNSLIKLKFRGKNIGNESYYYNFLENEFIVNPSSNEKKLFKDLEKILKSFKIFYLHGYPSFIYDFSLKLKEFNIDLFKKLFSNIKVIFFGSEYPPKHIRNFFENELNIKTVSWYGHSECAVLAYEKDEIYKYYPFQLTYGYCEAKKYNNDYHLIGTTLMNFTSPLIRYDTEDLIDSINYKDEVLHSFKISRGRLGDSVIDKDGRSISLTSIIHGRHHEIFEKVKFIQVKQIKKGHIKIYLSLKNKAFEIDDFSLFDNSNLNFDIDFEVIEKPFLTRGGKVKLLVE